MKSSLNKWGNRIHDIEFNELEPTKIKNNEDEQRTRVEAVRTELERVNKQIKQYEGEINRLRDLEKETLEIIKNCNPEWFGYMPKGVPKLSQILYYIS
jgi:predicted  nucleic acid-binding Zn-ribbon protein